MCVTHTGGGYNLQLLCQVSSCHWCALSIWNSLFIHRLLKAAAESADGPCAVSWMNYNGIPISQSPGYQKSQDCSEWWYNTCTNVSKIDSLVLFLTRLENWVSFQITWIRTWLGALAEPFVGLVLRPLSKRFVMLLVVDNQVKLFVLKESINLHIMLHSQTLCSTTNSSF